MQIEEMAREWARKNIADLIKKGGTPAHPEQTKARLDICRSCPHFGAVEVNSADYMPLLPEMKLTFPEGCTICGCPATTKPFMKEVTNTYLEGLLKTKKITCPHPNGNKWEAVDKQYL